MTQKLVLILILKSYNNVLSKVSKTRINWQLPQVAVLKVYTHSV